jgi:hypothetical protein
MVFKPWDAIGSQPRHILNDIPISSKSKTLPVVKVIESGDEKVEGTLLVLPYTLKAVLTALVKQSTVRKVIATVEVWTNGFHENFDVDEEFAEDEQLYKIKNGDNEGKPHVLKSEIEVWKIAEGLNVLSVENYQDEDIILFNLIAAETLNVFKNDLKEIFSITPGTLPFGVTVGKLSSNPDIDTVKFKHLSPPFYITGIAASFISQEQVIDVKSNKTTALVLQSEGIPGFEKINLDSVREVSFWLSEKFGLDKLFVAEAERLMGAGKSVNNFALYI